MPPLGSRPEGFKPGSTASIQYAYDNNGNMTQDAHKSLYNISYNFLNLPEDFGNMQVTYDATGKKWKKVGAAGNTEYLNGIEYRNGVLEAIYVGDGRLVASASSLAPGLNFRAEYFHQDHLGNNRLTFCDFNNNGRIEISDDPGTQENELEITQETHYYPFGLEHKGNWYATVAPDNNYLYNGKELNRDYDINLYEYGARWYDPAIGRWNAVDPLAESYYPYSPYNYVLGNPIKSIDPNGMSVDDDFYYDDEGHLVSRIKTNSPDRFYVQTGSKPVKDDPSRIHVEDPVYSEVSLDSDLGHMARTVYAEGAGQSGESKLALAEVIRNRADDDTKSNSSNNYNAQFSDVSTYEEVVKQNDQFESVETGAARYANPLSVTGGDGLGGSSRNELETSAFSDSMGAAIKAHNKGTNTAQGATYFFSPYIKTPSWTKSMTKVNISGVSSKDFRFYKY